MINKYSMKLVTIVCEALAQQSIVRLLNESGAHGYTVYEVQGAGAHGERFAETEEFANVKIEVIVSSTTADKLLHKLQKDFFPHMAIIVYESDVSVLRQEKFKD
jgi:nitrogen regulatory protein P-II 2